MPIALHTQCENKPCENKPCENYSCENNPKVVTSPLHTVDATPQLSTRTLNWLAQRPHAQLVVNSVWNALAELERADHHPGAVAALRFMLVPHEPTAMGRCRACRRLSWHGLWRRRPFPCPVWRQVRGELLGHLTISDYYHRRTSRGRITR